MFGERIGRAYPGGSQPLALETSRERSTTKRFYTVGGGTHNDPQPLDYYDQLGAFFAELP